VIEIDKGVIVDYREKPSLDYKVSMGIYVYEPEALNYLPSDGPCQFPDLVLALLADGKRVAAFPSDAEWYDIGTIAEYERAIQALESWPDLAGIER
jgi:NDP-sugar pyrophosphorylase family protein